MGAPVQAFVDHYSIVGVDPKADIDQIHRAYAALAAKHHPNNKETGDRAKYDAITASYEVLSDPIARKAFDRVKLGGAQDVPVEFDPDQFLAALGDDRGRRLLLLSMLYSRRKMSHSAPGLSVRVVEALTTISGQDLSFVSWYLKQKGLVTSDDKGSLVITVEGMDYVEQNNPDPSVIRPFLKVAAAKPEEAVKPSVNAVLTRAIANMAQPRG